MSLTAAVACKPTCLSVSSCRRVQFNRSELMSEMVRDVDVMPVEPFENIPEALAPLHAARTLNGRALLLPGQRRLRVEQQLVRPVCWSVCHL